jgi:hypothetical protein
MRVRASVGAQARACDCARVALVIQHSTRRNIVICRLSIITRFSTLSHKRHDFWKNITELKMRVLIFSTTFI